MCDEPFGVAIGTHSTYYTNSATALSSEIWPVRDTYLTY